jgi:hypothetical protein
MRGKLVHWVLAIFLLSGGLAAERLAESSVKHTAEEESSSERQDESFKAAASRKRNSRAQKIKKPRTRLLTATVWHGCTPFPGECRLSSPPATPWNSNLHQLHQVFRI